MPSWIAIRQWNWYIRLRRYAIRSSATLFACVRPNTIVRVSSYTWRRVLNHLKTRINDLFYYRVTCTHTSCSMSYLKVMIDTRRSLEQIRVCFDAAHDQGSLWRRHPRVINVPKKLQDLLLCFGSKPGWNHVLAYIYFLLNSSVLAALNYSWMSEHLKVYNKANGIKPKPKQCEGNSQGISILCYLLCISMKWNGMRAWETYCFYFVVIFSSGLYTRIYIWYKW